MSEYARQLRQVAEILMNAINEANSKEQLDGYFDYLATDEGLHFNYLLEQVDMEPFIPVNPVEEDNSDE